jgi:HSP20 family protein
MNALSMYRPVSIENALSDFDRILGSFLGESPLTPVRSSCRQPAVDILKTDGAYFVEAELPGLSESDVLVHVEGKVLTIESAAKEAAAKEAGAENAEPGKAAYVVRERQPREFSRSFTLPDDADGNAVSASFKNGLLTLEIQKRPEEKRRVIQIKG